jgi:hypothetical protein
MPQKAILSVKARTMKTRSILNQKRTQRRSHSKKKLHPKPLGSKSSSRPPPNNNNERKKWKIKKR